MLSHHAVSSTKAQHHYIHEACWRQHRQSQLCLMKRVGNEIEHNSCAYIGPTRKRYQHTMNVLSCRRYALQIATSTSSIFLQFKVDNTAERSTTIRSTSRMYLVAEDHHVQDMAIPLVCPEKHNTDLSCITTLTG